MFTFIQNIFRKDHRLSKRKKIEYIVACKPLDLDDTKRIVCSDEVITKTEYVSQNGLSIHWPDNYKCHLCKHKIDVVKGPSICELVECRFDSSCFNVGSDVNITMQMKGEIFENLKAKVIWHKESNRKLNSYGKMGISFYEPIKFEA